MNVLLSDPLLKQGRHTPVVLETVVDGVAVIAKVKRSLWSTEVHLLHPYRVTGYVDTPKLKPEESALNDLLSCLDDGSAERDMVHRIFRSYRDLLRALPELRRAYGYIEQDLSVARTRLRQLDLSQPVQKKKAKAMMRSQAITVDAYDAFVAALREKRLQALNHVLAIEYAFVWTAASRYSSFSQDDILALVEGRSA